MDCSPGELVGKRVRVLEHLYVSTDRSLAINPHSHLWEQHEGVVLQHIKLHADRHWMEIAHCPGRISTFFIHPMDIEVLDDTQIPIPRL